MLSNVTFASRSMDLLPELFTISELMKRPREVIVVFTHIAFVAGVALDVAMARRRVMIIWHLTTIRPLMCGVAAEYADKTWPATVWHCLRAIKHLPPLAKIRTRILETITPPKPFRCGYTPQTYGVTMTDGARACLRHPVITHSTNRK